MTWEEDEHMQRLLQLFRSRGIETENAEPDHDAQRRRSDRIRYFLTVYGSIHYADRVVGSQMPIARRAL
jgi:hypothetical protein